MRAAWRLRLAAGLVMLAGVGVRAARGPGGPEALLLLASGLITGHLLIGVRVFVCRLRALSVFHQVADLFAFLFLAGAVVTADRTPWWCGFHAGLFAVALLKYRVCAGDEALSGSLRAYARKKLRLEVPTVPLFAGAGVVTAWMPAGHAVQWLVPAALAAGALWFGFELIVLRRMYRFEGGLGIDTLK